MSNNIQVGVIGFGTIGTGVVRALLEKRNLLSQRLGSKISLKRVCDRDLRRSRGIRLPAGIATTDVKQILNDPDIQIVVELIGGIEPARSFIKEALRRGKHVVTANKALLADSGPQLFKSATKANVDIFFEAAVGGGIPIIKAIREGLVANDIDAILGILNGTSNYILTKMAEEGSNFRETLLDAKRHGYAEANSSLDINGNDAAHKLIILTLLGFGVEIKESQIYTGGISQISQADIQYAKDMGYVIKPLAIAKRVNNELEVRVHPTLLERSHLLANVNGVYNAIYIHGDMVRSELFYGRGAGQNPTASAVIADIIDAARNIQAGVTQRIRLDKHPAHKISGIRRIGDIQSRYYMRFMVKDQPGVLARIAGVLGKNHISLASVNQKERGSARIVPVVMMTHEVKESNMRHALSQMSRLGFIKQPVVVIRTEPQGMR